MAHPRRQRRNKQGNQQGRSLPTTTQQLPTRIDPGAPIPFVNRESVSYRSEKYSGPLMHPHIVQQWEELKPGTANILMEEFQAQSSHRRTLEAKVIISDIDRADRGLFAGVIVSLAAMGICALAIVYKQPWVAGVLGGGTIATLAGVFIYGSQMRRAEREQKSKDNP